MFYHLKLPSYNQVAKYEGQGNWAVDKYYKWPHRFFYRHKLKMCVDMIKDNHYYNTLDFGSGYGIMTKELLKYSDRVISHDRTDVIDLKWGFDLIIALSVMEFVNLDKTVSTFKTLMDNKSELIIVSPMSNWITRKYFNFIKDYNVRNSHQEIKEAVESKFKIKEYK